MRDAFASQLDVAIRALADHPGSRAFVLGLDSDLIETARATARAIAAAHETDLTVRPLADGAGFVMEVATDA